MRGGGSKYEHLHPEFVRLYQSGESALEIAARFGCHKKSVYRALAKAGIRATSMSEEEKFLRYVPHGESSECWPWRGHINHDGYGRFIWEGRLQMAHRIMIARTSGPIPPGQVVRHLCHNPSCCNPSHLLLGSQADNVADRQAAGRTAIGVAKSNAKLTDDAVWYIRTHWKLNETLGTLSERFAVSTITVLKAARRETWAHVD